MATLVINPFLASGASEVELGMELRMSERSEHYDIHTEFQVPRIETLLVEGVRGVAPIAALSASDASEVRERSERCR